MPRHHASRAPLPFLVLLAALAPLSMDAVLPSLPALGSRLDVGPAAAQSIVTSFAVGFSLGQVLWGPLADRFGRRPVLLGCLSGFAVCNLGIVLMPDLRAIVAWRGLAGTAACAGMVLSRTLVLDTVAPENRARAIGTLASAMFLAPALGPVLGGFLQQGLGWQAIFAVLVAVGTALAAYVGFGFRETMVAPDRDALRLGRAISTWSTLLRSPSFRRPSLVVAAMSAAMFAFITASPAVLMGEEGLSPPAFGAAYMVVTGAFVVGAQAGRRIPAERAKRWVALALAGAVLAGLSLLAWALARPEDSFRAVAWFVASASWFYAMLGVAVPLSMAAGLRDCDSVAGRAAALQGFLQAVAGAAASAAVGRVPDAALGIGGFVLAGAVVASAVLARTVPWRHLPDALRTYVRID